MLLETINSPQDLKKLSFDELTALAAEMRHVLIEKTSMCGGHLGSNLGLVEISIALHYVFNSPEDKMVFDVSHQTYCHKMLTGRQQAFTSPSHYEDVIGFSNPRESKHDWFNMGHTSTSISLACGLAKARDMEGLKNNIIAIIGDGSMGAGPAFEGLNYAVEQGTGLIVILNDNGMSIQENHGGLYRHLAELRDTKGKAANNMFKAIGFEYLFVEDGNNLESMIDVLKQVRGVDHPVLIHAVTKKGLGYQPAMDNMERWHWANPFDVETGTSLGNGVPKENYGAIAAAYLMEKMKNDPKVGVVTAATAICIGFNKANRDASAPQYVDVGIQEQHAVSMVTAMAKAGCKPVFATNSTFIQRAYDQIEHELCITQCPATLIITHASVSAHNNITHSGLYDIALLGNIPGLVYLAPTTKQEYLNMLDWSIEQNHYPVAIRVPWNGVYYADREVDTVYSNKAQYEIVKRGSKIAVLALGGFYQLGESVVEQLKELHGVDATLINPRYITGIDEATLEELKSEHDLVVTIEDGILNGGFGAKIAQYYGNSDIKVMNFSFSSELPIRFNAKEIMESNGLTVEKIVEKVSNFIR